MEGVRLERVVKPDKLTYATEMTAAGAAVAVFVAVYIAGFMHAGVVLTLLLGWAPAALLGWLMALAVRSATRAVIELSSPAGLLFGAEEGLQPIALRRRGRRSRDSN